MRKTAAENTNFRLKAVLDVLAEGVLTGESQNAGEVLAEALVRVPLNAYEAELLSGGIPRGHKSLTTATAKLVKAGWLVKGRSGWTITEDGLRATVAFPDEASFAAALDAGTPVPAGTPLPVAAPAKPAAKKASAAKAEKAPAKGEKAPTKTAKVVDKAAKLIEDAVAPVAKAVRGKKAEAASEPEAPAVETVPQPEAVAVAGDFNTLLGAPENWAPQYDEAQMELDSLDQLWKLTADIPAGYYTFKIALNRSWEENYGAFGAFDGANHELHHDGGSLTIRYDHRTRDITVN
ncbi:glycosidase [Arthrobacter sp. ISL-28]|uniref:pullulanase X25 domain-containing protein n=1 Tax=Arthrobacter sp. ISL-28 TaxID=2819108 RepID=UPI001BEAFB4A|nr:glycosidase [Arthrobacter sp. ISL-28]MBT2523681.1 glycosidase [Arthrobacter sp. ISL-28]